MQQILTKIVTHSNQISTQINSYASQAMRVLAFAWKRLAGRQDFIEEGLVFVGLQAMIDPPRPEVFEALDLSRKAGVRVIMITGDYPETARSIGEEVGITGGVLTGAEMDTISDAELDKALAGGVNIFARVIPEHKQRIVTMLQHQNHTVAMTGDVNMTGAISASDIIHCVNYVFKSGPSPQPCEASGDVNCNGSVTSSDVIFLVNYVFKGQAEPCDVCPLIGSVWSGP